MACAVGRMRMAVVFVPQHAVAMSPSSIYFSLKVQKLRATTGQVYVNRSSSVHRRAVCQKLNAAQAEAKEAEKEKLDALESEKADLDAVKNYGNSLEEVKAENSSIVKEELEPEAVEEDIKTLNLAEDVVSDVADSTTKSELEEVVQLDFEEKQETLTEDVKSDNFDSSTELEVEAVALNIDSDLETLSTVLEPEEAANTTSTAEPELTEIQFLYKTIKEAIATCNEESLAQVEFKLQAIQQERDALSEQAIILSEEISRLRDGTYSISMEFENLRRAWEQERLVLEGMEKAKLIESLLVMVERFTEVKTATMPRTEAEQKIANSYRGIERQFLDSMKFLGAIEDPVVPDPPHIQVLSLFTRFWDQIRSWFSSPRKGLLSRNGLVRHGLVELAVS